MQCVVSSGTDKNRDVGVLYNTTVLSKLHYTLEAQLEPYAEYEAFVYARTRGGASNEMIERFTTSEGG